jgi:hypothetical protein
MTPHEEITHWIDTPGRSFQAGYNLYVKYGRNRNMMLYLSRKQNMEKLVYELRKVLTLPIKGDVSQPGLKPFIPNNEIGVRKIDETPQHKILAFEKIDPASLPVKLQAIHAEISEAYKFQRTYHEKLKLATTDELRASLRAEVIKYDDIISNGWDAIDTFRKSGEKLPPKATALTALGMSKQINASRSYITRSLKELPTFDEAKKEHRIAEIRKRVDTLIKLHAPVAAETKQSLVDLQIITGKSKLLSE